jgi:hypothetical protein
MLNHDLPLHPHPTTPSAFIGVVPCLVLDCRTVEVHTCGRFHVYFSPLNAELNPVRHLRALLGARHILHVSRIRIK